MNNERRDKINRYIQNKGDVKLKKLEEIFTSVSSMTLRRDLVYLEEKGHIVRVRGGAKSVAYLSGTKEPIYSLRETENIEGKIKIAEKALPLIETGRSIFLDSGTTMMCLAQTLKNKNLSVLTSGPNIAMEMIKNPNSSVNIIGGQLSRDNLSISGAGSLEFVKSINIDIAFIATSGFSIESGFTGGNFNEGELKSSVIKKARKRIMLMDSTKFNKDMPFTFATLKDIDILICDQKLPESILKAAEKNNVIIY